MSSFAGSLKGKKTYIVAILGIVGAVASYLTGDVTAAQAFQAVLSALLAMGVRNGIANS